MKTASFALALAALVSGCGPTAETKETISSSGTGSGGSTAGTTDTDGDYLTDAEEASLGTDPQNPDTDGDSYLDGDEVLEETDPLDPESRIYEGGWPYQRFKDDLVDPGFGGTIEVGAAVPRLIAYDQFGQQVDLYDFAKHGKPVVLDLSALWCDACKDLSLWLEGEPSGLGAKPEFDPIPGMVAAGDIYWITIVFEDAVGAAAEPKHAVAWAETFPNEKIAVLADNNRAMFDFMFPGAYPSLASLEEDMTVRAYDRFDYEVALQSLLPAAQ